jgi:hypothetical protein
VTVIGVDDNVVDGTKAYTIITTTNTGSTIDSAYSVINPDDVTGSNYDNDRTVGISSGSGGGGGRSRSRSTVQPVTNTATQVNNIIVNNKKVVVMTSKNLLTFTNTNERFVDTSSHWAHGYIQHLRQQKRSDIDVNLLEGYTENNQKLFKPNELMTLGQYLKIFLLSQGFIEDLDSDTKEDQTKLFATMLATARKEDIIRDDNAEQRLNKPLNRAEAVVIAHRILFRDQYLQGTASFVDTQGQSWFSDELQTLREAEVVVGYQDGSFKPASFITRAEAAAMAARSLDLQ